MNIWIGHKELAELLLSMDCDEILERLKGTCPEGSTSASGSPTREAGGGPDANKMSDRALPFPDQGWGAIPQLLDYLDDRAAEHESDVRHFATYGHPQTVEYHREMAAAFRLWASAVREIASLTQSVVDGAEENRRCELLCGPSCADVRRDVGHLCHACPMRGKREERSVSGNDQGLGRRSSDSDPT